VRWGVGFDRGGGVFGKGRFGWWVMIMIHGEGRDNFV